MRTLDEIMADPDRYPFSNGTSGERWQSEWCHRCKVDAPFMQGKADEGCPLLLAALLGVKPREWTEKGSQDYACSEFVPEGEIQ